MADPIRRAQAAPKHPVRSWVVRLVQGRLTLEPSGWQPGYTPAHCSTKLAAIEYARGQAEQEREAAVAKLNALDDMHWEALMEQLDERGQRSRPMDQTEQARKLYAAETARDQLRLQVKQYRDTEDRLRRWAEHKAPHATNISDVELEEDIYAIHHGGTGHAANVVLNILDGGPQDPTEPPAPTREGDTDATP